MMAHPEMQMSRTPARVRSDTLKGRSTDIWEQSLTGPLLV